MTGTLSISAFSSSIRHSSIKFVGPGAVGLDDRDSGVSTSTPPRRSGMRSTVNDSAREDDSPGSDSFVPGFFHNTEADL